MSEKYSGGDWAGSDRSLDGFEVGQVFTELLLQHRENGLFNLPPSMNGDLAMKAATQLFAKQNVTAVDR